ncbi:MAG: tetratricopeptide repeat protein [Bacteroidales bacterium]
MLCFFLSIGISQGKNPTDSLRIKLKNANNDSVKAQTLIDLGDAIESSEPKRAIEYYKQALRIAEENAVENEFFQELNITCTRYIGIVYHNQNANDKAMEYFMRSLRLSEEHDNKGGMAASMNNIGMVHADVRNYESSIEYYQKSLNLTKELSDTFGMARSYNNMGVTYANMGNIQLAIENYQRAADAFKKLNLQYFQAATYNNIGTYYLSLIHETNKNDSTLIYYQEALRYFQKAVPIFREMEEQFDLATSLANVAQTQVQLYEFLPKNHPAGNSYLNQSIASGKEALDLSKRIKSFSSIYYSAHALKEAYKNKGNISLALEYAELLIQNNDSLLTQEKERTVAEIEAVYQTEKKEQEIERQRLEAGKQRLRFNALAAGLLLLALLTFSLYRGYKNKKKAHGIITEQNSVLEQANAEIMAQRDELEAQRDMVVSQNHELEEVYTNMTHSLQYAQSIQAAILPSEKILQQVSPDFFVMMRPCELVSGDFFWATAFDDYQIFGVTDCTGHGVPGAFMSILGVNALNDIVTRHRITNPSDIMGHLRHNVIEAMSQNDPEQIHKDGMDMSLCVFNRHTRELHFAGAGLPLWIVTDTPDVLNLNAPKIIKQGDFSLIEVKGDIMPIGQSPIIKPFTNQVIKLGSHHIRIYMSTDGFADQFEEGTQKKYGISNLKSLILENAHKDFAEQKKILENTFDSWKGKGVHIDDVTVLGIKI